MSAPLSNAQKAHLARLCQRAYNLAAAQARGRGEALAEPPEEWRHSQVAKACGKAGLRCCSQDDYHLVHAHLLDLVGEPGRALNALVQGQANGRRVAEWKVRQACAQFGLTLNYADSICRQQHHGLGIADVGEKALWQLVYTIRNRGLARRRHTSA
jgi:hypothetical protein